MVHIVIEALTEVLSALLITLIGVLGAWLTVKIGKRQELASINAAQQEVIQLAQLTVEELQQTIVEQLKSSHQDGKLTKDEIALLGNMLVEKTMDKLSDPAAKLLRAATVDVTKLIQSAGESWINSMKGVQSSNASVVEGITA